MRAPLWWQYLADAPWRWLDVVRHPWHGPPWVWRLWYSRPGRWVWLMPHRVRTCRLNFGRRRALREHVEDHARALVASGEVWRVRLTPANTDGLRDASAWAWCAVAQTWWPPVHDMSSEEEWWAQERGGRFLLGLVGWLIPAQPAAAPGVRT